MRSRNRTIVTLAVAFTLLAAACTQSSSGGEKVNTKTSTSKASGDTKGGGELTASAEGVTADSIKIGYSYLDFKDLVDKGLSPQGWGDQEKQFKSAADALNAKGGINGRKVDVVFSPYSALGTQSAEAACLKLTSDDGVFAVLGGFLGPAEPANTCIAGKQGKVLVGGVLSEERLKEAKAPWITDRPLRTRQAEILMTLLKKEGMLADAKVAMVTSPDAQDVRGDVTKTLEKFDVKPVADLVSDAAIGDITAEDNVWSTFAEKIRSEGVNTVLIVGNASAGIRNIASQGLKVKTWVLDQETLTSLGSTVKIGDAKGAISAAPLTGQALWDDKSVKQCRDDFTKAYPDEKIIEPDKLKEGDEDIPRGLVIACRFLSLFQQVAEKAGPNLTNDSFAAAAADLSQFTLPGQPFASLSAEKHDASDSFELVSFNPDIGGTGGFDSLTPIADVTE